MNIQNTLKIVKSLKLSFDVLGYAVIDGKITTDRNVYRGRLRSGKVEKVKQCSDDRTFQVNRFYNNYFADRDSKLLLPSYKDVVKFLLTDHIVRGTYTKHIKQVARKLLDQKHFELFILPEGRLVKDAVNGKDFYISNSDSKIYRLVNGKSIIYKVQ